MTMTPTDPTDPKRVTVGEVEATPLDTRPSRKLGDTTTVELLFQDDTGLQLSPGERYMIFKRYQTYAGEASYGAIIGGEAFVRERPTTNWPVESHVVSVVYGDEHTDRSFWGVITSVEDNSQIFAPPDRSYGIASYSTTPYGETTADTTPTGNIYRLDVEIARLARIEEYADRDALFADLTPDTTQL